MVCLKNKHREGHGSSPTTSEAGNSSRTFRLLRSAPKGVK